MRCRIQTAPAVCIRGGYRHLQRRQTAVGIQTAIDRPPRPREEMLGDLTPWRVISESLEETAWRRHGDGTEAARRWQ